MRTLIANTLVLVLLGSCAAEKTEEAPPPAVQTAATDSAPPEPANENAVEGTFTGQIKVDQPVSMFNYVGAESGDFAPIRFLNDSENGRKILAACGDDDLCEFTGAVEWLDEEPPPDASAIGQILRVDRVKRLPPENP